MSKKEKGVLTREDISAGVLKIEGLSETPGYEPSKYKETKYDSSGKESSDLNESNTYAKKIINGNSQLKHFVLVDGHGIPVNPKDNSTNSVARNFSRLAGSPSTRLVPVTPATFTNYIEFLQTGNMAKYHLARKV